MRWAKFWGLGIGDWGFANPQSPIPNPQSPLTIYLIKIKNVIVYLLIIDKNKVIQKVEKKRKLKEDYKCEFYKDGRNLYGPKRYVYACDTRYYF